MLDGRPKFTPGPWVTGKLTKNGYRKIDTHGFPHADPHYGLAKVVVQLEGDPYKRGEANAALIAAAPDLYAALDDVLRAHHHSRGDEYVDAAYTALAKARGEKC
jgi:hypothetical protein